MFIQSLTERCFYDAVTEVAFSANRIRTGGTETRHSNTIRRRLTKPWQHRVSYTAAVNDVFLIDWIVSVERRVVDEETVNRTVNTALQLRMSNFRTSLNWISTNIALTLGKNSFKKLTVSFNNKLAAKACQARFRCGVNITQHNIAGWLVWAKPKGF